MLLECPLKPRNRMEAENFNCRKEHCSWWCGGEQACVIKVLGLQAIKIEEVLRDTSK